MMRPFSLYKIYNKMEQEHNEIRELKEPRRRRRRKRRNIYLKRPPCLPVINDRHDQVVPLAPPKEPTHTDTHTREAAKVASPD